jgi:hypothetical protein
MDESLSVDDLRHEITRFTNGLKILEPLISGTKPSEPLSTHNSWMQAEYDGKKMVYDRVVQMAEECFGAPLRAPEFQVGDPVAILDPNGMPLRFGKVVEQPNWKQSDSAGQVHVCWDGNPSSRTYSFHPDQPHRVVNLREE